MIEIIRRIFEHWKLVTSHPRSHLDDKRSKLISARLKDGYTEDDLKLAAYGCSKSRFHQGGNEDRKVYDSVELIYRGADKVDQFIRLGEEAVARDKAKVIESREQEKKRIEESTTGDVYQQHRAKILSMVGRKAA